MEKMKLNIQRFSLTVTLTATETAIDDTAIANNQSYINLSIRVQTGAPTWNGEKSAYYQVTTTSTNEGEKTGSKYYFSIGSSSGSGDKTFPVTLGPFSHNSDGSLAQVAISVYVRITSSTHTTKTKNVTMATIPRASDIDEINNGTTPYYPTIKWTPKNNTFKYKVQYVSSDGTTTLTSDFISPNKTTQHEYSSLQIPNSFFSNVKSNYKQIVTAKLYTYKSDETPVVEDPTTKDFTITLSESIKPIVSISNIAEAGNIVPSSWGIYVKGKSKISYRVNYSFPTPVPNSAAILVSCNGVTRGSNAVISTSSQYKTFGTSSYLANAGSLSITAAVTDSRTRKTANINTATNVVDYDVPDVTLTVYRCTSSGTASDSGTYYHYAISGHYQSCKNGSTEKNSITTLKIGYRVAGSTGSFTEVALTPTVGSTADNRVAFTATGTTGGGNISTANNYEIQVRAIDVLSGQANALSSVSAEFKLINYKADGKGIAIGKKSTTSNLFEVAMDTKTTKSVQMQQGSYNMSVSGGSSNGYMKIMRITITGTYFDTPIRFNLSSRGNMWATLNIKYTNANSTDPSLNSFTYISSDNCDLAPYIYKSGTSTWDVYVYCKAYQVIEITQLENTPRMISLLSITYPNEFVSSLPSGGTSATIETIKSNVNGTATTATTASKTSGTLTVKMNGTSKGTFNGSSSPSIDLVTHPVGSIMITNTNVQPTVGGSWTLIDKEFSSATGTTGYTRNTTNCTELKAFSWARAGHTITFSVRFTNKVKIEDTALTMFTLNWATFGITALPFAQCGQTYSDLAKCAAFVLIETTGAFQTVEVIPDNYISAGRDDNKGTFTFVIPKDNMVDSACNKFYWKRDS